MFTCRILVLLTFTSFSSALHDPNLVLDSGLDDLRPDANISSLKSDGRYIAFFYPPPGACFPESQVTYLSIATSDAPFLHPLVLSHGIEIVVFIDDSRVAAIPWSLADGLEADEGLSHHLAIPGLPDGEHIVFVELIPWLFQGTSSTTLLDR